MKCNNCGKDFPLETMELLDCGEDVPMLFRKRSGKVERFVLIPKGWFCEGCMAINTKEAVFRALKELEE